MATTKPKRKDPADVLDYRVLWSDDETWDAEDVIVSSTFAVDESTIPDDDEEPLTVDSDSFTDTVTTVWLSGGTLAAKQYTVVNHIETSAGREMDKEFYILMTDQAR